MLDQLEAGGLVHVARGVEASERPEIDAPVAAAPAEVDRRGDQPPADALPAKRVRHDEPAEVSAVVTRMEPVDGDGALDPPAQRRGPEAVAPGIVTCEKSRQLGRHLRLEG